MNNLVVSVGKRDIIESLELFSDREKQYDQWMNTETPGMYSLEEAQHCLFDGVSRVVGDSRLEDIFSKDLCLKLGQFEKIVAYNERKNLGFNENELDHPKLIEMSIAAAELLPVCKQELEGVPEQ